MADRSSLEAVSEVLTKSPQRNFDEAIEISINLKELDLTVPKNRIEDEVALPNGRGRLVRVAVIGTPELLAKARGSADRVLTAAELDELTKDKKAAKRLAGEVDFFLAEAPLMPVIG